MTGRSGSLQHETVKKRNGLGLAVPSFKRDTLSGGQVALEDYSECSAATGRA